MKTPPIFIHIPKVAGGSIRRSSLAPQTVAHDSRSKNYHYLKDFKTTTTPFSFSFVRNPWDRCVSAFRWLASGGNSRADERDAQKYLLQYRTNFTSFIRYCKHNNDFLEQLHFKPQHHWICDDDGNILIDFIGRFESLQADFDRLCDILGSPREKLRHNKKPKKPQPPYTEYYNNETRKIIKEKYAQDIDYFGYQFGD